MGWHMWILLQEHASCWLLCLTHQPSAPEHGGQCRNPPWLPLPQFFLPMRGFAVSYFLLSICISLSLSLFPILL